MLRALTNLTEECWALIRLRKPLIGLFDFKFPLCSLGWAGIHFVEEAGLEPRDLPIPLSAFWLLL